MPDATLEHVNVTVSDPKRTAGMLCDLFGWHIRWEGTAKLDGYTIHVGGDNSYLAIYAAGGAQENGGSTYHRTGGLNHIGVVVDDLDATERAVRDAGYEPHSHADYEPGRRFYFNDHDDIEIEVVSYADPG